MDFWSYVFLLIIFASTLWGVDLFLNRKIKKDRKSNNELERKRTEDTESC